MGYVMNVWRSGLRSSLCISNTQPPVCVDSVKKNYAPAWIFAMRGRRIGSMEWLFYQDFGDFATLATDVEAGLGVGHAHAVEVVVLNGGVVGVSGDGADGVSLA